MSKGARNRAKKQVYSSVVSSVQELERLEDGSVIQAADGNALVRTAKGFWITGEDRPFPAAEVIEMGPFTVLGPRSHAAPQRPRTTHEPDVPINWPDGYVSSKMTGDDDDECIIVEIHGVMHYLHSTTARALQESLGKTLDEWNEFAREQFMKIGIVHKDV